MRMDNFPDHSRFELTACNVHIILVQMTKIAHHFPKQCANNNNRNKFEYAKLKKLLVTFFNKFELCCWSIISFFSSRVLLLSQKNQFKVILVGHAIMRLMTMMMPSFVKVVVAVGTTVSVLVLQNMLMIY